MPPLLVLIVAVLATAYAGPIVRFATAPAVAIAFWRLALVLPITGALALVFAGRRTEKQQQHIEVLKTLSCRVSEYPYLDHRQALQLLGSASMSCIFLADVPGAERVVPAKVFECMAARRPLLAIAPPGEMTELLSRYAGAHIFHPRDTARLADFLAEQVLTGCIQLRVIGRAG